MENIASKVCKFVYICITRGKSYHFSDEIVAKNREAELIGTFHLSPNGNIVTIARMKTFTICFI